MGFNPRISPYSLVTTVKCRESSQDANNPQYYAIFRFPFAGQIIGAYANLQRTYLGGDVADAAVEATTVTGVQEISLWKNAADDTTATYATSLRACARTGNKDTSTGGGLNWRAQTAISGAVGLYTLTNKSAARRKFAAGDVVMMKFLPYGVTDAHRSHNVELQMDYIIGEEAS